MKSFSPEELQILLDKAHRNIDDEERSYSEFMKKDPNRESRSEKEIIAATIIRLFESDSPLMRYLIPESEASNCGVPDELVAVSFGRVVELLREEFGLTTKNLSYSHVYPTALFNAELCWDESGIIADLEK